MTYRIDTSMNDAPYQGIHIFDDDIHVITFHEDDAPVPDYNRDQAARAKVLVHLMNELDHDYRPETLFDVFKHAAFTKPEHRLKPKPTYTGTLIKWTLRSNMTISALCTEHTTRDDFIQRIITTSKIQRIVVDPDGTRVAETASGSRYKLID